MDSTVQVWTQLLMKKAKQPLNFGIHFLLLKMSKLRYLPELLLIHAIIQSAVWNKIMQI